MLTNLMQRKLIVKVGGIVNVPWSVASNPSAIWETHLLVFAMATR